MQKVRYDFIFYSMRSSKLVIWAVSQAVSHGNWARRINRWKFKDTRPFFFFFFFFLKRPIRDIGPRSDKKGRCKSAGRVLVPIWHQNANLGKSMRQTGLRLLWCLGTPEGNKPVWRTVLYYQREASVSPLRDWKIVRKSSVPGFMTGFFSQNDKNPGFSFTICIWSTHPWFLPKNRQFHYLTKFAQ